MNLIDMYIEALEDSINLKQVHTARKYLDFLYDYELAPYQQVIVHNLANKIQHLIFETYYGAQ